MHPHGEPEFRSIEGFGGNLAFRPKRVYEPSSEDEVRGILERHRAGETIRVIGALHSWSPLTETPDVAIDLRRMNRIEIHHGASGIEVVAEAGCTVDRLLRVLEEDAGATLPAIGAVTRQTIAGAIATGTHGSGQASMSHFVEEVRVVAWDGEEVVVRDLRGDALPAARCALGCLGVVVRVRLRCVRRTWIAETVRGFATLGEVLAQRDDHPVQYFLYLPFAWRFVSFLRHPVAYRPSLLRRASAAWCRLRNLLLVELGFHFVYTRALRLLRRPGVVGALYRFAAPVLLLRRRRVVDRSDRALTLRHHLFRHVEMELAVPEARLAEATELIRSVTEAFAGVDAETPENVLRSLEAIGMRRRLEEHRGSYVHSYPLSYRLVLPDDTWLSQSSDGACYTISWFSYEGDTPGFHAYTTFLARSLATLHGARPHWGKLFRLEAPEVERLFPRLEDFRHACREADPRGSLQNDFTRSILRV